MVLPYISKVSEPIIRWILTPLVSLPSSIPIPHHNLYPDSERGGLLDSLCTLLQLLHVCRPDTQDRDSLDTIASALMDIPSIGAMLRSLTMHRLEPALVISIMAHSSAYIHFRFMHLLSCNPSLFHLHSYHYLASHFTPLVDKRMIWCFIQPMSLLMNEIARTILGVVARKLHAAIHVGGI